MAANTGEWHKCPVCRKGGPNTRPLPKLKRKLRTKRIREELEHEETE